ncbi:MAG: CRTAC1 family protein [Bryobacteraceae bacterium]
MKNRTLYALAAPVLLAVVGGFGVVKVDQSGLEFFETGKAIEARLGQVARDFTAASSLDSHFDPGYSGQVLGLTELKHSKEKDGIRQLRMSPGTGPSDRASATGEWTGYRATFDAVEETIFHIHRMERWGSGEDTVATVRFEVLGTPRGTKDLTVDRGMLRATFRHASGSPVFAGAELIEGERLAASQSQFTDVAEAAGVGFVNRYYPRFINEPQKFGMIRYGPGGITVADYDRDGFQDLFIPDGVESKLFRNNAKGGFEDVTAQAGLAGLDGVSVAVFADYDNDGHKDLFVSRTYAHNQLFRNNGDGTFADVTEKSGIEEDCCTTVASWGDYNNDGYLDLYVGRYMDPRTSIPTTFYARNGEPNSLYKNNGNGTFTNVTKEAGVGEIGLCLGSVFGDFDEDGWADLYVVNDFGRNTLYHNNGDGTFSDVSVKTGTLAYGAGMSATFGDYDNDLKGDFYCANIRSDYAWYAEPPTVMRYMTNSVKQNVWASDMPLYWEVFKQSGFDFVAVFQQMASGNTMMRNRGDGTFEDTTVKTNANPPGWFWGTVLSDFDNDGWQDIYAANGWVYNDRDTEIELEFLNNVVSKQDVYKTGLFFDPKYFGRRSWHGWERNRYLRNDGTGVFEEVGRPAGSDLITNSRGVAVGDFWNRGVLDIAVSASTDKHALLRNELAGKRNWFQVELIGTESNRDAIGARIVLSAGGGKQMRTVIAGDSYSSQSMLRQHFGLAGAATVDELTVHWPKTGKTQKFTNLAANRIVEITEGKDTAVEKKYEAPR